MKAGDRVLDTVSEEAGIIVGVGEGHPLYAEDTRTHFALRSEDSGDTLWRTEDQLISLEDVG